MKEIDDGVAFKDNFQDIITAINKEAIKSLNKGKFEKAKALLLKCDSLT